MIGRFLTWWGQQLGSLLPRGGASGDAVIAAASPAQPQTLEVTVRRRGRSRTLGRFALDPSGLAALRAAIRGAPGGRRGRLALRLPPGALLEQVVTLPLAAERDPERVLQYEMDRLTPFAAAELFWSWAMERRDAARGQLQLRLALVPRAQVAAMLDALAGAGLHATSLQGAAGGRVDLARLRGGRWQLRATVGLLVLCAALAATAAVLPFARQSRASRRVEARIAYLQPAVTESEALRRRLAGTAAVQDALAGERARVGDALAVLAALTAVLPDDAVLTDLALRQRQLAITGQALAAARLIPALAADPAFRNPSFAAPVTRNETAQRDGFSIRAEAAP